MFIRRKKPQDPATGQINCQCPGKNEDGTINPKGYVEGAIYYTGANGESPCTYDEDNTYGCPCGVSSPGCGSWLFGKYSCEPSDETSHDSPFRYCN